MTTYKQTNKAAEDRRTGKNNKISKAVLQYDLQGNFIKEHWSINQASRETGIAVGGICLTCKGRYSHSGGFKWEYKHAFHDLLSR